MSNEARSSTAPAVKTALKALFDAATDDTTLVFKPRPRTEHKREECVYIGDVTHSHREYKNLGGVRPQVEESYIVEVQVEVERDTSDGTATEERLWQIVEQLEVALAPEYNLGNTVDGLLWAQITSAEETHASDGLGYLFRVTLEVTCTARIR